MPKSGSIGRSNLTTGGRRDRRGVAVCEALIWVFTHLLRRSQKWQFRNNSPYRKWGSYPSPFLSKRSARVRCEENPWTESTRGLAASDFKSVETQHRYELRTTTSWCLLGCNMRVIHAGLHKANLAVCKNMFSRIRAYVKTFRSQALLVCFDEGRAFLLA
jgi:hypothetical protein